MQEGSRSTEEVPGMEALTTLVSELDRDGSARTAPRRPSRRTLRVMLAAVVTMVLIGVILVTTGAGSAIASRPLVSPWMSWALPREGVVAATPLNATATASGYTIRLVSGYADAVHTVLVVHITPSGPWPKAMLTDASGAVMPSQGGSAPTADSADKILGFDPLPRAHSGSNALTLRVNALQVWGMGELIPGDWTLNFALLYRGGSVLPNPAPGELGPVTVTFETVAASSGAIRFQFQTEGATVAPLDEPLQVDLYGPNGKPIRADMGYSGHGNRYRTEWNVIYRSAGPGTYRFVITWSRHSLERKIVVR